ncbi:MAG TPA: hypothetical protein DCZ76_12795, partial [Treponema sp.]|nr:hypothetical protein [Treponema sp.]
ITFGAWLRVFATPVANDGDETRTVATNSWGGSPRAARLNVTGVAPDGKAGFNYGIFSNQEDGDTVFAGPDDANLWVKPIDMLTISYGIFDNNKLRGDLAYGIWNWQRPNNAWYEADEGLLMTGMKQSGEHQGLLLEVEPMENLYVQALVPITNKAEKAADTYKKLRGGFAYTVPGLLRIKGQYIGMGASKTDAVEEKAGEWKDKNGKKVTPDTTTGKLGAYDVATPVGFQDALAAGYTYTAGTPAAAETEGNSNCNLEAEVDVLAVEGLFAGVGFRYDVRKDGKTNNAGEENMKIALGVSYQVMPELKVSANGAYLTYYGEKVDPRFQAGAGVDYDLGDGLAASADFRYKSKKGTDGKKDKHSDNITFSVGVTKSVSSNGLIGVAFEGTTNSGGFSQLPGVTKAGEDPKFNWAIPIKFEVSF